MKTTNKFSPEVRGRAVRMVSEHRVDYPSEWAAMTSIAGKIRLSLTPWLNHGWQVPLYVTARGLATSAIPAGVTIIDIEFDFVDHRLVSRSSSGDTRSIALRPMTVATFYREVMAALAALGVHLQINLNSP